MPNITKLQLSEELYNIAYDPITLDQEESSSTTSAPSSNYLKTVVESLNQSISDLSGTVNSNLLSKGILPIATYIAKGYNSLYQITSDVTSGVYCIYGNAANGNLIEFDNAGYSLESWICGIIGIQGPGDYFLVGANSNSTDKIILARASQVSSISGNFTLFKILEP